jgi:hypothetical protein
MIVAGDADEVRRGEDGYESVTAVRALNVERSKRSSLLPETLR